LSSHLGQSEVEYRKVEMLARNEQDAENRRSHASKDKAEVVLIAYIKEDGEYLSYIDYFKNSAGMLCVLPLENDCARMALNYTILFGLGKAYKCQS